MRRLKIIAALVLIIAFVCFTVSCTDDTGTQTPPDQQTPPVTDSEENNGGDGGQIDSEHGSGSEDEDEEPQAPPASDGSLTYSPNAEGGYTVTRFVAGTTAAVIPDEFNGKPVTEIGEGVFRFSRLVGVQIGANVKKIGDRAFSLSYDLAEVTFADGSVLAEIGEKAFYCCESLEKLDLPESVTALGAECFAGALSLSDFSFGPEISRVGKDALQNTLWLTNANVGVIYISATAYGYKHVPEVNNPYVQIEDGTVSVADGAFEGDERIIAFDIPASVTHIGYKAFAGCTALTSITVDALNPAYYAKDNALVERESLTVIKGVGSVPEGAEAIGDFAYAFSSSLDTLILPETVERIGISAFEGCVALVSVEMSEAITVIPDGAFRGDTALSEIKIHKGVTLISGTAFSGCTGLKTVYLDSPAVIVAADMSTSLGHLLENADTVFVSENAFLDENGDPITNLDPADSHPYLYAFFERADASREEGYVEWNRKADL